MRDLDGKALQAKDKKALYGPDVDLQSFKIDASPHAYLTDLRALSQEDRDHIIQAGIDTGEQERSGTFIQKDTSVIHAHSRVEGLEIIPIKQALETYDWVQEYYWKLASVDTDKFTAQAHLNLHDGYVIRALPGAKVVYPVQACLYIGKEGLNQNVHNLIIAEEDSELHMITGCQTAPHVKSGLHVGISEFYVKKNAKLSFTMIHNWAEEMMVRPRSVGQVEEGGLFLNNYICMKPVKSIQMYPTTHLVGKGAVARFYSLLVGSPGCEMDVGGRIFLKSEETRAEIIARTISNGGTIISRGELIGDVPGIKAHLECRGLILKGGIIHAIPELVGRVEGVEMSHEAAVGKIAQEEVLYLMSRGLTEDEAVATIVRGFLTVDIPGLPSQLKAEIDRAVDLSDKEVM
ncbi:MAG TPA: SufD family Fe-S cluster assembly protein [Thermodesulfobacteriota bacterium]|nr:SufD family Fe-S cluster assembly protein [Deltaproteobacteria bacterium]HNU70837.1 SufD family Fe-S cluster assembly protein [Thermodesulfobacteriota bacterium]HOC39104.1 SufD family Fe-S cluster assembly protein [Thermodesulfobacteriota bacterium]HQO77462.1 SufD family Fe-S cluster assembly protein [Thermodesulfobacteriota bacterium]